MISRLSVFLPGVMVLLTLCGCSKKEVTISGKLVEGGKPLQLKEKQTIRLDMIGEGTSSKTYNTKVSSDGTFTVEGKIEAGKYYFSLSLIDDPSINIGKEMGKVEDPMSKAGGLDRFKGAFQGTKSPLVLTVDGSMTVTVDLTAKSLTKN